MSDTPIFDEVAAELWENHHIRYSQLIDDTVVLRPKNCKADIVYVSGTPHVESPSIPASHQVKPLSEKSEEDPHQE